MQLLAGAAMADHKPYSELQLFLRRLLGERDRPGLRGGKRISGCSCAATATANEG